MGFPDDYVGPMRVPFGDGSAGRAVSERRVVLVDDIETSPLYGGFRSGALQHGVRAALSVPMLTVGGEPMGALAAYYRERVVPEAHDLHLVALYASQAAEMVERARLHAEARSLAALERRRSAQLRALADAALRLTAADAVEQVVAVVVETARELSACATAEVERGPALPEAVPLVLPADRLELVLRGREDRPLAVLRVADRLDGTPFTAQDAAVLVQLGQLAASTVERIEAYEAQRCAREDAERTAGLLGALSRASAVFAESFEPDGIGRALVDLLVPRMAEVAALHLVDDAGRPLLSAVRAADPSRQALMTRLFRALPVGAVTGAAFHDDDDGSQVGPGADGRPDDGAACGRPGAGPVLSDAVLAAAARDAADFLELRAAVPASSARVSLRARGRSVGVLHLARDTSYAEADLAHVRDLARQAALGLDNAGRYAFERHVAVTLQRSLLPRDLPMGPGYRAAARYLPGARGTEVGGDWYDVVEADGALVLVMGDVVGRGVRAASVMGQLQATVRAYALDGHGPAAVLTRLDRVALAVPDLHFSTCLVARLDPATGALLVSSAGHPPPVVTGPAGARLLELDPGLPLGVADLPRADEALQLGDDEVLLLYTDGLVEERGESLTEGLARLLAAVERPVGSADEVCAQALAGLGRDAGTDDDTALLAVHRCGAGMLELRLPRTGGSVRAARRGVRSVAAAHGLDADDPELLVSELVGNAVRHGAPVEGSADVVVLRAVVRERTLRVEVDDASGRLPGTADDPGPHAESGRGLLLVEAVAARWGAGRLAGGGTRVWFEVAEPS